MVQRSHQERLVLQAAEGLGQKIDVSILVLQNFDRDNFSCSSYSALFEW
jgi:hypothetical protein